MQVEGEHGGVGARGGGALPDGGGEVGEVALALPEAGDLHSGRKDGSRAGAEAGPAYSNQYEYRLALRRRRRRRTVCAARASRGRVKEAVTSMASTVTGAEV